MANDWILMMRVLFIDKTFGTGDGNIYKELLLLN